jgi:serine/threonine protein kinase
MYCWNTTMIGKTISHYRIIGELGRGGMGLVYKAEDTKLNRTVALKFLPPELTCDPEVKARFIREAQAASALQHNNICTIHDIDETPDGQLFIVMDCYEGETLKTKIIPRGMAGDKEKRLKTKDSINIAIQIAEGLTKAHEKGIVHRDIKPANIFITNDDEVKILDFGLAKLAGKAQLTKDSSTLGTVAYMSPEQLSGKEIDHRSDIWSLGVILYEMLTGDLPFKGDYEQAISYAILNEDPKQLENFSVNLQEIVNKLLVKNPNERYDSLIELLNDLTSFRENYQKKSVQKSTRSSKNKAMIITVIIVSILVTTISIIFFFPTYQKETSIKSLAVLPFTNLNNDSDTDYLGPALAADIINDLVYIQNLNVLPFSVVRNLDDWPSLNVEFILTGNYLKEKDKIRLSLELIRSADQHMLWNEAIEENFENAFVLQDKVSDKVINELSVQFAPEEKNRMRKDVPKDPLAYKYYLESLSYDKTVEGLSMAIKMLNKSIQIDSAYAPAFTELGYRTILISELTNDTQIWKKAEKYFRVALNINSESITAMTHLAMIYIDIIGNADEALQMLLKASEINPHNASTHFRYSYLYRHVGLLDKSEKEAKMAIILEPNNPKFQSIRQTYIYLEKYNDALEACNIIATDSWRFAKKGEICLRMGNKAEALKYFNRIDNKYSGRTETEYFVGGLKAYILGNKDKGIMITEEWERQNPASSEVLHWIACNYSLLGDKKSSVRVLKRSIDAGFFNYPFFLIDPFLDPVRNEPEFKEVLALAREKHEAFKQKYF